MKAEWNYASNGSKKSVLTKENRYPGLFYTSRQIGAYFPQCKIYCEPFSGLGRTVKYARCEKLVLNDISEYANNFCKKKFRNAIITNEDFIDCIKRWDSKDTFFLIDPPWRLDFYDNKETSKINRKTATEYLKELGDILPTIKGSYIVTLESTKKIKSLYSKLIIYSHSRLFGNKPKTMMFSNRPLKVQIPQITEFIEC